MAITDSTQFGKMAPFRFWCQKVLPAVYDDSLSYYELLCKVSDYINQLIEVTNTQSDAITELQETLQMFLDGEITPYIDEKIDEWFAENQPDIVAEIAAIKVNSDKVPDIETNLAYLNNHLNNNYSNSLDVYVNDISGDDDNDGLTDATAFKTIEKALGFIDKGYSLLNVRIRSNGVYFIERKMLANCTLHITVSNTVTDASLYWAQDEDLMYFYNVYLHLGGPSATAFKNYFPVGFHFDAGDFYFNNVTINASTRFDTGFASGHFIDCDIVTNNYLRITAGYVMFTGTTNFTTNTNGVIIFADTAHINIMNTFNIISNADAPEDKNMFRFDQSVVNWSGSVSYINTYSKLYDGGLVFVRSFGVVATTILAAFANFATTACGGNYSIIKANFDNTIINS